jgi:catechol 2,3-dioxygenase-like lactoylglutathione lyase family enzyme
MGPVGLHHVTLNVDDVDASVKFYTEALGLKVRSDRPDFSFRGAWLDAGSQQVHLVEGRAPENLGQHFALAFSDLSGIVARLREKGYEVTEPAASGTSLQAFVVDPAGNRVELHQPGTLASGRG